MIDEMGRIGKECMYKGWARNQALAPRPSMIYCAFIGKETVVV
jgi:hypothetical protein